MSAGAATVRHAFRVRRAGLKAPLVLRAGAEAEVAAPQCRVPRVARLLALAHKLQGMLDRGEVGSMAELARLGRVSRARVTQIMDLLMLAPDIQEEILFLEGVVSGPDPHAPRGLMRVCRASVWAEQREMRCSQRR